MQRTTSSAVSGVAEAGLTIIVQPAASAGPSLRVIIAAGKFQGVIAAVTPTGWRSTSTRFCGFIGRQRLPVDALGLAREPLEERGGVDDLALGLGQRLALLVGHHAGDVIGLGEDAVGGAAQDAPALERGQRLPRTERLLGGVDRALARRRRSR